MNPEREAPVVSVVMGAYNSADTLEATIDSVLSQAGPPLELIVVDDGSTDDTRSLLQRLSARDPRLVSVHQANTGLTLALIRGCRLARGEFIARQDAGGDRSLPGRFARQVEQLRQRPDAVMVSCATRFVGPDDELLYECVVTEEELRVGLNTLSIPGLKGPSSHPGTLFRRAAYEAVGGYRAPFVVAQDMDLWLRLIEHGACIGTEDVLYQSRQTLGSISSRMRGRQFELGSIAVECARRRRSGQPEPDLSLIDQRRPYARGVDGRRERADFHFFIGACVDAHDRAAARRHFLRALRARPLHARAWWRLLRGMLG